MRKFCAPPFALNDGTSDWGTAGKDEKGFQWSSEGDKFPAEMEGN